MTQRPSNADDLELWSSVDRYYDELLSRLDPVLAAALADSRSAGLPDIQVSPSQGKLLHLVARSIGARRILEIGTLGGYSSIWLARALPPNGRLITLELNPRHAALARSNLARAGLAEVVEVRAGAALETLPNLVGKGGAAFDLVFIDADKPSYPEYLGWALALSRKGTVIVADNVVRRGDVLDGASPDENVRGVRRMNEMLASEPRVSATVVQTVGAKGHDGFTFALVLADP